MDRSGKIVFWLCLLPFGIFIWLLVIVAIVSAALGLWSAI